MQNFIRTSLGIRACVALAFIACMLLGVPGLAADDTPTGQGSASAGSVNSVPAYRQADRVAIITIDGEIDKVTFASIKRRLAEAKEWGADAVVFEINTPGGDMWQCLEICSLIKDRTETPPNVVAWVNPSAYSAGSIIALACREIVVAPNGRFGDAAPIGISHLMGLAILPAAERAKAETFLLTEVVDSARRNHYDEKLVQSLIRLSDGLWMLQNKKTNERVIVDKAEYRAIFGEDPPTITNILAPAPFSPSGQQYAKFRPWSDQSIPHTENTEGLTREEVDKEVQKNQDLPSVRQTLTSADRHDWILVRQVVSNSTLLNMTADEGVYYGLASTTIASEDQLKAYFGAPQVRHYNESWSEELVRFLISFWVKVILIVIFLVCLFVEISIPGFGIFGITSLVALALLVGAPALIGLSQWWTAILVFAGIALVAAEVFVIPGTGITGVAGVACILVGLVMSFVSQDISSPAGAAQLWTALLTIVVGGFTAGVAIWLVSRHVKSMPLLNRVILHAQVKGPGTILGTAGAGAAHPIMVSIGMEGLAVSDLRPSGRGEFDGRIVDVSSVGSYIEKGAQIRVVSARQYVIEVEEVTT